MLDMNLIDKYEPDRYIDRYELHRWIHMPFLLLANTTALTTRDGKIAECQCPKRKVAQLKNSPCNSS